LTSDLLARLHAEVTGPEDAPPLLVLHGWGSSAAMMRPVAEVLSDRFRVHNLDLPGHGQTPPPPAPWGVPEYAALVADYLDAHGIIDPLPAIGHSNGGRILLHLAGDAATAHRFARLVLVSPSGVRRTPSFETRLKRTVAKVLRSPFLLLPEGPLRAACLDWLRHSLVWRWLGSADYNRLSGVMRETFVRTVGHFVEDRLARIAVPVLVFWGDRDADIVREQVDRLVEAVPDAGLVVLEGAGHYGYLDRMDVFEAATRHFLEAMGGDRSSFIVDGQKDQESLSALAMNDEPRTTND
jgi:pimeloyl-ACP methyl ester carboxylesterase